jgi:diadenosine tetraphosphate (Ap4A) HIT family hydrolase
MPCTLCDDRSSAGESIFDFGDWELLLHPDSAVRGHAIVATKRHVENFADLTDAEAGQFARIQKVCERALLDVTKTDRAILLKLGIAVPHFHLHIYPVSRSLDRAAVMSMIEGRVSEVREPGFARAVRERILRLT